MGNEKEQKKTLTEETLQHETNKWLARLKKETRGIKPAGKVDHEKVENSIKNIKAYIKDAEYFVGIDDMVRAFEAVVYAWGIYETCLRLEVVKK